MYSKKICSYIAQYRGPLHNMEDQYLTQPHCKYCTKVMHQHNFMKGEDLYEFIKCGVKQHSGWSIKLLIERTRVGIHRISI